MGRKLVYQRMDIPKGYAGYKDRYTLEESPDYGFNKLVYIRGTREGYKKIEPHINASFNNPFRPAKDLINAKAFEMINRYVQLRNEALSILNGKPVSFTEKEYKNYWDSWFKNLTLNRTTSDTLAKPTAITMKSIQNQFAKITNSQQQNAQIFEDIIKAIEDLENFYNSSLTDADKQLLNSLLETKKLTSNIIQIKGDQLNFTRIVRALKKIADIKDRTKYIQTLSQKDFSSVPLSTKKVETYNKAINREFGAIHELMQSFSLIQVMQGLNKNLTNDMIQVGERNTDPIFTQKSGKIQSAGRGTTDARCEWDQNKLKLFLGSSIKLVGTIIDSNGNWTAKTTQNTDIKIKDIRGKTVVWNQIKESMIDMFNTPTQFSNAVMNTLVWSTGNNYKMIRKSILANFFEKYIAGGGKYSQNGQIDFNDFLIINGIPIPIYLIISQVIQDLVNDEALTNSQSIAYVSFKNIKVNKWQMAPGQSNPDANIKSTVAAVQRSYITANKLEKNLQATIFLNGNRLLSTIQQYINKLGLGKI